MTSIAQAIRPLISAGRFQLSGAKEAAAALNNAAGFLRGEIARNLHLRKAPELKFIADDSIAHGMEIIKELETLTGGKD